MKGVNVILKGRKTDNYGYLKISYRHSGKTKVYSLGIKLKKSDFNSRTQRVRSSNKEADIINRTIEDKLASLRLLPYQKHRINTICEYMKIVIDRTLVIGTKDKYNNVLTLFQKFLKQEYNKADVFFEELDTMMVNKFYSYLRKTNKRNTANYKIKSFKSFINKAKREGVYIYQLDPFISLELRYDEVEKNYLTIDELKKFIKHKHKEYRKSRPNFIRLNLSDIKEAFIFSTLAQGLRISDIITLRFNNFYRTSGQKINTDEDNVFIRKKMIKTKQIVNISLNKHTCNYIERQIVRIIEQYLPEYKRDDTYKMFKSLQRNRLMFKSEFYKKKKALNDIFMESEEAIELEKQYEYKLSQNEDLIYFHLSIFIDMLSENETTKNLFVFPFLDDDRFTDIDSDNDFSQLSDEQYLHFVGRRSYVNHILKKLMNQSKIRKKITFHSSRHTYTTLTLEQAKDNINLYDLQKALGHSSILSTQEYISSFSSYRINDINKAITSSLFNS